MKSAVVILIICYVTIGFAATISISGVVRDQAPASMKQCGSAGEANGGLGFTDSDFETNGPLGIETGLVGQVCTKTAYQNNVCGKLAADGTPVYAYSGASPNGNVQSPATFFKWFHSTPEVRTVKLDLTLSDSGTPGIYKYSNSSFFPVDGQGWKDSCKKHNYAFCWEINTRFGYTGAENMTISGNDDIFVYVAGNLVLDLGGVHGEISGVVSLKDFSHFLTKGSSYRLAIFGCNRHSAASTLRISTNINPYYCSYVDWCGVCEGNGQSCCTPDLVAQYCNDNNSCTYDQCTTIKPPQAGGCTHSPISCSATDVCQIGSCSPTTGCVYTPRNCDDGDACTQDKCNSRTGCVRTVTVCNDFNPCTTDTCDKSRGCVFIPVLCNDGNACTKDSCNATSGKCITAPLSCPDDGNMCTVESCDKITGCRRTALNCDDANACTSDICDPRTGCSNTPVACDDSNAYTLDSCSSRTGCVFSQLQCNDTNECTIDSCDPATGCSFSPLDCDDADACTLDSCDPRFGCTQRPISCDDDNECTQDSCDSRIGCVFTNIC